MSNDRGDICLPCKVPGLPRELREELIVRTSGDSVDRVVAAPKK